MTGRERGEERNRRIVRREECCSEVGCGESEDAVVVPLGNIADSATECDLAAVCVSSLFFLRDVTDAHYCPLVLNICSLVGVDLIDGEQLRLWSSRRCSRRLSGRVEQLEAEPLWPIAQRVLRSNRRSQSGS